MLSTRLCAERQPQVVRCRLEARERTAEAQRSVEEELERTRRVVFEIDAHVDEAVAGNTILGKLPELEGLVPGAERVWLPCEAEVEVADVAHAVFVEEHVDELHEIAAAQAEPL